MDGGAVGTRRVAAHLWSPSRKNRRGLDPAVDFILSGRFLDYAHPMHLWFLEYLIVFYVLAAVVVVALPRVVPSGVRTRLLGLFRSVVRSVWAPLPLGVLSFLVVHAARVAG